MNIKRWIAGITASAAIFGGITIEDIATADLVATLNDPITLNETMKFSAPSHTVEVSDNGLIELVVGGDKRYSIMPSQAHGNSKALFLDIENHENEVAIKEVFGAGSELTIKNTPRSFSKVVSFTEDYLKTIPEGAEYVEVSFDLSGWNIPDGSYTERIQLQQDVWLEKALAWDSSEGDPNQNYTDVAFVISGNTLTKKISVEWLNTAVFPIYTDATFTFGTKELADTGPSSYVGTQKIGTDKFVTCWSDTTDTSVEGRCQIASVSGTDLTFGSISNFTADIGASSNQMSLCSAGDDRWVVTFQDDADNDDGTARVASSTGTTINGYGTELDFFNTVTTNSMDCAYIATDKIVISYGDSAGSDIEAVACTISATYTLSCGTAQVLQNDASGSQFSTDCTALGTDKFACLWSAQTSFGRMAVGTVSGTTITLGTVQNVEGAITVTQGKSIISPATNQFAISWLQNGENPRLALGTVSGTTITLGATTTKVIATTTPAGPSLVQIDADSAFLVIQQGANDAATTFLAAIPIELNFGSLTYSTSTAEQIDASTDIGSWDAINIGNCKFTFIWEDDNDTNDLFATVGDTSGCVLQTVNPHTYLRDSSLYIKNGTAYFKN